MDFFYNAFIDFKFKDVIDILIVAILIYQFMLILKGSRALQVLLGFVLLGVLFFLGSVYELNTLNWILTYFFESFFLLVIILFQDQIRTALATMASQGKFFGGFRREFLEREIDEIIEATNLLARERVGALIVFERSNSLLNTIQTGTQLNCQIQADIIYALFQSRSPLHDGAMIIAQGKIAAAGCFLPLSSQLDIDRRLGSRHRAALGISEETDSVAIVVSEEKGRTLLVVDGQIINCQDEHSLRTQLKHLWSDNSPIQEGLNKKV